MQHRTIITCDYRGCEERATKLVQFADRIFASTATRAAKADKVLQSRHFCDSHAERVRSTYHDSREQHLGVRGKPVESFAHEHP